MTIYRYSEQGVEALTRRHIRRSQTILCIAMVAGLATANLSSALTTLQTTPILVLFLGFAFWMPLRLEGKLKAQAKTVAIEFDDETLTGRDAMTSTTIHREDVTELRYLSDGLMVRGRTLPEIIHLKNELERFAELVARIEAWAPLSTVVRQSKSSFGGWVFGITLANLGLMAAAFTINDVRIAIPLSILEAALLVSCCIWVWRSNAVAAPLKRKMLFCVFPILSLLGRAYLLWNQAPGI